MNQQLWSRFTAATLLITTLSIAPSGLANQPGGSDEGSEANVSTVETPSDAIAAIPTAQPEDSQVLEVAKVGEYQSQEEADIPEQQAIATIFPHQLDGRSAATLYVRNIPVLTFLGTNVATADPTTGGASNPSSESDVKVGSTQQSEASTTPTAYSANPAANRDAASQNASDPVWRATAIAAQVNQLDPTNAEAITVRWDGDRERYIIQFRGNDFVEMNRDTILPDTNNDPAEDALQAANRLRRQIGNAAPLDDIAGRPRPQVNQVSIAPVLRRLSGMASWYGPGFHGNRSASGEVFNQNALTAAHRSLPFGTQVRVTNLNTGQSVVVRINDRGPFSRGRVIDLSAGAARMIGVFAAGVAPVRLEVLGRASN